MDQGCRDGECCKGNYVLLDCIILTIGLGALVLRAFSFFLNVFLELIIGALKEKEKNSSKVLYD